MDKILNLIYKSSGADIGILNQCPQEEKNKYFGIGMTVIMTALFAGIGTGYLIYIVIKNFILSAFGGILWGSMTLILDRLLISTINKKELSKRFLSSVPRIILAIFIGYLISLPIQIKILEPQIESYLLETKVDDSLFSRIVALKELSIQNETIKWMSWAIVLLFIFIETAPVFVKIISEHSVYDDLLAEKKMKLLNQSERELIKKSKEKIENLSPTDKIRYKIQSGDIKGAIDDLFYLLEESNSSEEEKRLLVAASRIKHLRNQIVHNTIEEDIGNQELNKLYQIIIELSYELEKKRL